MPLWATALLGAVVLVLAGQALVRMDARPWLILPVWSVLLASATWWFGWRAAGGAAVGATIVHLVMLDMMTSPDPAPGGPEGPDGPARPLADR